MDFEALPEQSKRTYLANFNFAKNELLDIIHAIYSAKLLDKVEYDEVMIEVAAGELRLAAERVDSWIDELQLEQTHPFRTRIAAIFGRLDEPIPFWGDLGS